MTIFLISTDFSQICNLYLYNKIQFFFPQILRHYHGKIIPLLNVYFNETRDSLCEGMNLVCCICCGRFFSILRPGQTIPTFYYPPTYRVSQEKVALFEVNFLKFYELSKNQFFCIGKRKDRLKFWGVIYELWLTRSKVMLKWIKISIFEITQKP